MKVGDRLSMETKYKGVGVPCWSLTQGDCDSRFDWIAKNFVNGAFNAPSSYTTKTPWCSTML